MSFYEENRVSDLSLKEVIDYLYPFFPDIEKEDILFLYHGTYNVFDLKNQFILRIPDRVFRNHKGVQLIQNEVKMLFHIQRYISIPIPEPIYVSIDPDCPFMVYEKIDGIPLSKCFKKISKNKRIKIAGDIGQFLTELHSKKICQNALLNNIVEDNFSCKKYREEWKKFFDKIQTTIFHLMNLTQKKWIINLFNSFLTVEKNFNFKYSIIHGDFDISNILVDPNSFKITGIVDFEESRIYDRAIDFIFYEEGDYFLEEIISNYKDNLDENFKERIKFLYGRACLRYIEFGLENNLPDMINAGFQLLNTRMKRFPI
jgi:aminoglycoside phosphotransferase